VTNNTQIDVASLVLTTSKNSAGTMATATVSVLDSNGQPVMGAVVTIQWSGIVTGTGSGTTDHTGSTSISSKRVKKAGTISASVIGLTAPTGYSYNSNLYAAPVVQSVTVAK
jgi:hypothetical protein